MAKPKRAIVEPTEDWAQLRCHLKSPAQVLYELSAQRRIGRRHITTSLRGTNQYPDMTLLVKLLKGARRYYLNQRPDMVDTMRRYCATYGAALRPATAETMYAKLEAFPSLVIPPTAAFVRRYVEPYQEKTRFVRTTADLQQLVHDLHS